MPRIVDVDEFVSQGSGADWIERFHGEVQPVTLSFKSVAADGTESPFDLTTWGVTVTIAEITVDVEATAGTRQAPDGTLRISNPVLFQAAGIDVPVVKADQATDPGVASFTPPNTIQPNPDYAASRLPAQVVWIELTSAGQVIQRALGIFYRTGRPR